MRTQTPRFLLGSSKGWKTFDASSDCLILPGFSSYEAAENYCRNDNPGIWELQGLGCDQVRVGLKVACPQALKLVAIDPIDGGELSLSAISLDTVCHALHIRDKTIEPDYRLMRDHSASPWNHVHIADRESGHAKAETWYVACLHPQNLTFAGGQPPWFWVDWFDGKHLLTELQTEARRECRARVLLLPFARAAEGFYGASVARFQGCVHDCQINSDSGSEFELTMWQKDQDVCNRTSAAIGKRV